ncbi:MAG: hypothetical protein QOJ64_2764 [Acidobacteriota bacterium]|nr:hypothetical protein [Acidobacteriota bacterium]
MKRILLIITAITLAFVGHALAKTVPERKVAFQRYESYFERNDSGLTGDTSYLVFTSQAQFDKIFHPAATGGQNNFLAENAFKNKVVVATIARGNFIRTYDSPSVSSKNGKLYVWYKISDRQQESATYASPLILAVDKARYSQVIFMQDGKRVGSASIHSRR